LDAAVLRRTQQLADADTRLNTARAYLDDIETAVEAFRAKVTVTPLERLSTHDACQVLQLLGVSDLKRSLLEREQVTGASLAFMTEADMKTVFGIQQLGCADVALDCGLIWPRGRRERAHIRPPSCPLAQSNSERRLETVYGKWACPKPKRLITSLRHSLSCVATYASLMRYPHLPLLF